jgi:ABC-type sulfate transport system permease subunit
VGCDEEHDTKNPTIKINMLIFRAIAIFMIIFFANIRIISIFLRIFVKNYEKTYQHYMDYSVLHASKRDVPSVGI